MKERITNTEAKTDFVKCPSCNSARVDTYRQSDSFVYGTGETAATLSAVVPFRECLDCHFEFTDAEAEDARHDAICRHLGVMTPGEVAELRRQYNMTRAVFAAKSRIGEASLARWETGQLIQNAANDDYLYLLTFRDNMIRLECRRSSDRLPREEFAASQPIPTFRQLPECSSTPWKRGFLRAKGAASCI